MSTTAISTRARSRVGSSPSLNATGSVPPPTRLSAAQHRELEAELRRELTALDRRLGSERQSESAEPRAVAAHDVAAVIRATDDTAARRDLVASALARFEAGTYGACSRCGEPIPYGRLLVMPEATHCLSCSARS
jgi:DnaK suppressor protein